MKRAFVEIKNKFGTVHILLNNAGISHSSQALFLTAEKASEMININFLGAFIVSKEAAKLMMKSKFGRIVNIGSICSTVEPIGASIYSATKAAADMLILAWGRTYNLPYIIIRPTNNYGVGQYVEKLIPKTCKYLKLDKKVPLHNNGTPIRNWLHAHDTARAIITIINKEVQNEIYNIAGGFEQSNYDTVAKVIKAYNGGDIENHLDLTYSRVGQDIRYALDDSKLKALGWKPEAEFKDSLVEIVKYYKENFIW